MIGDSESFWCAQYFCQLNGGNLVVPMNAYENNWLASRLSSYPKLEFWLGAWNNPVANYYWRNLDYLNTTLMYFNWDRNYFGEGDPNSAPIAVIHAGTGLWRGASLSWDFGYVCSMPMPVPQPAAATCPAPMPAPTCPPPPTATSLEDQKYFPRAESSCQFEGGHLVSIHSQQENEFVLNLATAGLDSPTTSSQTWIGLYKNNGNWTWTDGTPVDYLSWVNNSQQEFSYCTKMITDYYTGCTGCIESEWMYDDCQSNMRAYVCKKPALV